MTRIDRNYLLRLSEMDDEDAFDPADLSPEELFALSTGKDDFIARYKAYYDDIKTSKTIHKEDW